MTKESALLINNEATEFKVCFSSARSMHSFLMVNDHRFQGNGDCWVVGLDKLDHFLVSLYLYDGSGIYGIWSVKIYRRDTIVPMTDSCLSLVSAYAQNRLAWIPLSPKLLELTPAIYSVSEATRCELLIDSSGNRVGKFSRRNLSPIHRVQINNQAYYHLPSTLNAEILYFKFFHSWSINRTFKLPVLCSPQLMSSLMLKSPIFNFDEYSGLGNILLFSDLDGLFDSVVIMEMVREGVRGYVYFCLARGASIDDRLTEDMYSRYLNI